LVVIICCDSISTVTGTVADKQDLYSAGSFSIRVVCIQLLRCIRFHAIPFKALWHIIQLR